MEWKNVIGSEYYEVSSTGLVRRKDCTIIRRDGKPLHMRERVMKPFICNSGYAIIELKLDVNKKCLVHRLVAESFIKNTNPSEKTDVNHIDGNKCNNVVENLEWCSKNENMRHAMENGLFNPQERKHEKHPLHKLTEQDVSDIRELASKGSMNQHKLALLYSVSDTTIHEIIHYKTWN